MSENVAGGNQHCIGFRPVTPNRYIRYVSYNLTPDHPGIDSILVFSEKQVDSNTNTSVDHAGRSRSFTGNSIV
jgi:hypothetical protein